LHCSSVSGVSQHNSLGDAKGSSTFRIDDWVGDFMVSLRIPHPNAPLGNQGLLKGEKMSIGVNDPLVRPYFCGGVLT